MGEALAACMFAVVYGWVCFCCHKLGQRDGRNYYLANKDRDHGK